MLATGEVGACAAFAGVQRPAQMRIGPAQATIERRRVTLWLSANLQPDLRVYGESGRFEPSSRQDASGGGESCGTASSDVAETGSSPASSPAWTTGAAAQTRSRSLRFITRTPVAE